MVVPGHARDQDDGRRSAWIAAVPPLMIGVGWCLRQFRQTRRVARRLRTEQRVLRRSEEQFRSLVANATDVIVIHEADGTIRYQSPAAERVWGYPPGALRQLPPFEMVHLDDLERARSIFAQALDSPRLSLATELRLRQADGSWGHFEVVVNNLLTDPAVGGVLATYRDIARDVAERKAYEDRLAYRAYHDPLTDLPNRALFFEALGRALARADRQGTPAAILFLDLDDLKLINDSLGHHAGDQLLVAVGNRLRACIRPGDLAARLSGDEFTVLLEQVTTPHDAVAVAERIVRALRGPVVIDGRELTISASIGIAVSGPGHDDAEALLRRADLAMYQAKADRKGGHVLFDESIDAYAGARSAIHADLRRAVDQQELRIHYQPIVNLAGGGIVGFEALVRWQRPEHGLVLPMEFIPAAEESGMILPIGRWVLLEACRQVRSWQELHPGAAPLRVSVNLSAHQLRHPHLVDEIADSLATSGLTPTTLRLELTESAVMQDVEGAIQTFRRLRRLGVGLAIDDFGTGYSSLSHLKRFPVDTLKIDRSFVDRLGHDPYDRAIVSSIVSLGKALDLEVTGEGIETAEQLAELRALGCDLGQGYYFGRPLPSQAAAALLDTARAGAIGSPTTTAERIRLT